MTDKAETVLTAGPVEVTPEMREAGAAALRKECQKWFGSAWTNKESWRSFADVAYRAMAAVAPIPLVPDGELAALKRLDAMRAERDAFQEMLNMMTARNQMWADEACRLRALIPPQPAPTPLNVVT